MAAESDDVLTAWYRSRIGDPLDADEVYGYWLFALGTVLSLVGVLWVIAEASAAPGARKWGYTLVMVGLLLLFGGGTYRLPLGRRATQLVLVGGVVSALGAAAFAVQFPANWQFRGAQSRVITLLYIAGLATVAASAIVGPVAGDRRDWREIAERVDDLTVERTELGEERDEVAAERDELASERDDLRAKRDEIAAERDEIAAERDALREERDELVAERERREEQLAALEREQAGLSAAKTAVASERDGLRASLDETTGELAVAERRLAAIDDSQASFEVYKDRGDEWRWRLVHQNRNIIATSGEGYSSDRAARRGMRSVKRNSPGANVLWLPSDEPEPEPETEPVRTTAESQATLELSTDRAGDQRWRLVHDNGRMLARSARGYATRGTLNDGLVTTRRVAAVAEYLTFDPTGFEVYEDRAGRWRWRLVHRNGNVIADSGSGYATRRGARETLATIQESVGDAGIGAAEEVTPEPLGFEVFEDAGGEFRWRLRHRNGNVVGDSGEGYTERNDAVEAAERVREYAPDANTLSVGDAVFELYEDEGGEHRWRLRHRNGTILAVTADGYSSRSNARAAVNGTKRNLPNAPAEWDDEATTGEGDEATPETAGEEDDAE
jgi:uncharacterized protein YegP (UPF0339 family)